MGIQIPKFGLNRNDTSSISAFATDVARAEEVGWDCAFLPDSQFADGIRMFCFQLQLNLRRK